MIEYCTLFDANYLTQGLILYESLDRHHEDYRLHIFAACVKSYKVLEKLALPNVTLYSVTEVETDELRELRPKLSHFEYICALKSSFMLKVLQTAGHVVYIDADSYFFGTGEHIIDSLREDSNISIAITPHRFTPAYKHFLKNGIFNAGFIYATQAGIPCLEDWGHCCISNRTGLMTDQRLLNGWPGQWDAHIIKHKGINLGPWNQAGQYHYSLQDGQVYVDNDPLVWYHFHRGMKPSYRLDTFVVDNLYSPYEEALQLCEEKRPVEEKRQVDKSVQKPVQKPVQPLAQSPRPKPLVQPPQGTAQNYCTYFNSKHLVSFLAMYDSMVKWCKPFRLWAMPIDDHVSNILKSLNLENVNILSRFDKSNQNLRDLKRRRSDEEYIRTLKPLLLQHAMKLDIYDVIYLDPSGYFFDHPDSLYKEVAVTNIAITPHRFGAGQNGKFNAGFMYFRKGEKRTFDCIVKWCDQVMTKCENSPGYFFEQKYLEGWPAQWGAYSIQHKGVNLAPWNQGGGHYQYEMRKGRGGHHLYVDNDPLVWYNFSRSGDYAIDGLIRDVVYGPYEKAVEEARRRA